MHHFPKYLYGLLLFFLLFSCGATKNQFDKGKYKSVVNSLKGKANKGTLSTEELTMYIKSVEQLAESTAEGLEELYASNNFRDWQKGYLELDKIEDKQSDYVKGKQLKTQEVKLVDIDYWDGKFGEKLYAHHWDAYHKEYEKYTETEDKNYLIEAHDQLHQLAAFAGEEINIDSLKNDCLELGNRTFTMDISDDSFNLFELRHLSNNVSPYDHQWSTFKYGGDADYHINVVLEDLDKDESRRSSDRRYSEEIIVEYTEGVDGDGNTVQVPVYDLIFADVRETEYAFAVNARVDIEIIWNKQRSIVLSESIQRSLYDNIVTAYVVGGDARAVPNDVEYSNIDRNGNIDYDYDNLIEELLENIAEDVEDIIEGF